MNSCMSSAALEHLAWIELNFERGTPSAAREPSNRVKGGLFGIHTYLLYPLPSIHKDGPVHVHTLTQNRVSNRIGYSGCFPPDMQAVLQRVWRRRSWRHCRGGVGDRWTPTSTSTGSPTSTSKPKSLNLAGK